MMMGWGSGWGWVGAVWMLLFWVALITLVVWVARATGPQPSHRHAEEILEVRFARGEIDRDEFEARKQELSKR